MKLDDSSDSVWTLFRLVTFLFEICSKNFVLCGSGSGGNWRMSRLKLAWLDSKPVDAIFKLTQVELSAKTVANTKIICNLILTTIKVQQTLENYLVCNFCFFYFTSFYYKHYTNFRPPSRQSAAELRGSVQKTIQMEILWGYRMVNSTHEASHGLEKIACMRWVISMESGKTQLSFNGVRAILCWFKWPKRGF